MNALSRRPLGGADMVEVSSLTLSASSQLFAALADASGRRAELLVLRLPEMQPLHATRFAVPSPVRATLVDTHSGWLYLLCAQPRPRLLRLHAEYGLSAPPGTQPEAASLPWGAALPFLLPFPEQRQLLLLGAPDPAAPHGGLAVCRLSLGEPLAKASPAPPRPLALGRAHARSPRAPSGARGLVRLISARHTWAGCAGLAEQQLHRPARRAGVRGGHQRRRRRRGRRGLPGLRLRLVAAPAPLAASARGARAARARAAHLRAAPPRGRRAVVWRGRRLGAAAEHALAGLLRSGCAADRLQWRRVPATTDAAAAAAAVAVAALTGPAAAAAAAAGVARGAVATHSAGAHATYVLGRLSSATAAAAFDAA